MAEAIANVNDKAEIKCILDGPDLLPYWVHDSIAEERCENETMAEAFFETSTKELWGRTDDESCVRSLESKANETTLAETCGIFSRYSSITSLLDNSLNQLGCWVHYPKEKYMYIHYQIYRMSHMKSPITV